MRTGMIAALCCCCLMAPRLAESQTTPVVSTDDWQRVDSLRSGTRIVVTLESGARRVARFRKATPEDLTIAVGHNDDVRPAREETLLKSRVKRVTTHDPATDGAAIGALAGGGAILAWLQMGARACGVGCENDLPGFVPFAAAGMGAAIGSVVGLLADRLKGGPEQLFPSPATERSASKAPPSRYFPARPSLRIGPTYTQSAFQSSLVAGTAAAPGFTAAVQVSRYVTVHVEYTATDGRFSASPGSVPDEVLRNVVPAASRTAGWQRGIESRRVKWVFSELLGVQTPPWGRVRIEILGGLGVQAEETRDYFDAYRTTGTGSRDDPTRTERVAGKYYVLNFESPRTGLVLGADAEIVLARGLAVVPMFRYNRMGDPGPSLAYGAGVHWRF